MRAPLVVLLAFAVAGPAAPDWPYYGGAPAQTRYSPLTQINTSNVSALKVAWTYDTRDAFPGSEMQCQPVVAGGVLYATSPKLRVFALDAATGKPLWSFSPLAGEKTPARTRIRGLTYWERGAERRLYFAARHWLYALDARTGRPVPSFGKQGRIDLREGFEGRDLGTISIGMNTPGVIYGDLLILGSLVPEGLPSTPGDIRAFDLHTGERRWTFHTIPHPGEPGHETWPSDAWKYSGGANAWAGLALDERRGLVFAATGSAAYDFYGANRHGDNLYANSILCLRAATGERVWHFQAVKHDIWDRDFPAPPSLITITKDGQRRDVVAQIAKNGRVYVLDRETGVPVFPMETVEAPASDVDGEQTARTQILPALPPPFTRQRFTEDLITTRTPEAHAAVRKRWLTLRKGGEFDPPSLQGTILFPGMDGGGEWGGAAYDEASGLFYVNANEMAWVTKLARRALPDGMPETGAGLYERYCAACHRSDLRGQPPEFPSLVGIGQRRDTDQLASVIREGAGRMPPYRHLDTARRRAILRYIAGGVSETVGAGVASPYDVQYSLDGNVRFTDPEGFPAVTPPWGTLTAIDMNRAAIAWQVPLGEVPDSGLTGTGSENYGGPVVTAGGLVFIGATNYDKTFRAFDAKTGRVVWSAPLPAAGNATPAVYEVKGKQYVVIAAGGGKWGAPSGGTYVAFALPDRMPQRLGVFLRSTGQDDPEQALQAVRSLGLTSIQVSRLPDRFYSADGAREFAALMARAGIRADTVVIVFDGESYRDREAVDQTVGFRPVHLIPERMAYARRVVDFASAIGARIVTFHMGFLPVDPTDAVYRKMHAAVSELAAYAAGKNVTVSLETGQETAEQLERFLDSVTTARVGVNFDIANLVLYGMDAPAQALRRLAGRVTSVHVKDGLPPDDPRALGREVPLGEGKADVGACLRILRESGFTGPLIIENYVARGRGTDPIDELRRAKAFIEGHGY